ncbi:hypothetical protein SNEBB_000649 [Seison nebaliae]|nr:hypothetical protein SNEBB_000649 [Seison nebaliae]
MQLQKTHSSITQIVEVRVTPTLVVSVRHDDEVSVLNATDLEQFRSSQFWPISVFMIQWHSFLVDSSTNLSSPITFIDFGCGNGLTSFVARIMNRCDDVILLDRTSQSWKQTQLLNGRLNVNYADFQFHYFDWRIDNDMERIVKENSAQFCDISRTYLLIASDIFYEIDDFENIIRNLKFLKDLWDSTVIKHECYVGYVFRSNEDTQTLFNYFDLHKFRVDVISCSDDYNMTPTYQNYYDFIKIVKQKIFYDPIYIRRKTVSNAGFRLTNDYKEPSLLIENENCPMERLYKESILKENWKINNEPFEYISPNSDGEFTQFSQIDISKFYILKIY